jgi:hypothetical protein
MKKFISSFSIGVLLAATFFPMVALASFDLDLVNLIDVGDCEQVGNCTARSNCSHGSEVCQDYTDENGKLVKCKCRAPGQGADDCACHMTKVIADPPFSLGN